MNLHVFIDAPFYVDHFLERCARLKIEGQYYTSLVPFKDVKHIKNVRNIDFLSIRQLIQFIKENEVNKIYIHYLDDNAIDLLFQLPKNLEIYWFFWGNDGYKHPELKKEIFLPLTNELVNKINPRTGLKKILDFFRNIVLKKKLNKAIQLIDYCCIQVKGDFNLIQMQQPDCKMKHLYFAYRGAIVNEKEDLKFNNLQKGKYRILLGNSANPSNNHIDALELLKQYELYIDEIICPLSYSGSKKYIDEVINKGIEFFGNNFKPLLSFLPVEEYQNLLDSIDIGVFYHSRQQAYSNTLILLQKKKKIFMNPKSTLYQMYRDWEIENVFTDFEKMIEFEVAENNNLVKNLGEKQIDEWYKNVLNV
ncbi:TDP-N-acetylfucosamine:lipid II N-acetylfucosaminyltransferase [Christiangramia salexigens]|uniref:4-alpha-L-fucosyltransferase n=1 Tax=Christiangramia salexigens TaxID=1913577 RepID=A0A1L3J2B6_9FLAO|nr:TDP-N-acetylfucosamine:lipid II N-acetylfucosaminyltransferase [Christiangramia salexigens]APG59269.1 hypothetical protein LPB144_02075 [Christiangramia salexigens]